MAEMLLWLLQGIPASQRQQLAGSQSPSSAQKCIPGDTSVSGQLSLPTVEPGLWEAALSLSHVPWLHVSALQQNQVVPVQGRTPHKAGKGTMTAQRSAQPWLLLSPSLCLSCEVTLAPGLSRVSVICPCRNQAPWCTFLRNDHCPTKLPTSPGQDTRQKSKAQSWGDIPEICTRVGIRHRQDLSGHRVQEPLGDRHPTTRLPFLLWRMESTKNLVRKG